MSSFAEFALSPELLRAIEDAGYSQASPIQAQSWPILLGKNCDFLGLAATGTGKTAAFAVPMLEKIDPKKRAVQALILCPTRELALQVSEQVQFLGRYKGVRALTVYGGASYSEQHRGLQQGLPVVVGTPGRICDHLRRGTLSLDSLSLLILDEADEMISMGFQDDLTAILEAVESDNVNTWLFSATMSSEVRVVADRYLQDPALVQINRVEMLPSQIEQRYFVTHEANKPEVLCKLIDSVDDFYGLIFCQTKALVSDLGLYLMERGYRIDSLHGDKNQSAREQTMRAFRERKVKVLICTDVAARGLDVKDITHVINYSIPKELDAYVHRIGRTARCGKSGAAFSLISPKQRYLITQIEKLTRSKIIEGNIPTRKELGLKKVSQFLEKFQSSEGIQHAMDALNSDWKSLLSGMQSEEVAARFLALSFPEVFGQTAPEKPQFVDRNHREGPVVEVRKARPSAGKHVPSRDQGPKAISPTKHPIISRDAEQLGVVPERISKSGFPKSKKKTTTEDEFAFARRKKAAKKKQWAKP